MKADAHSPRVIDLILEIGAAVSGGIMVALMLIVCIKVFFRYFLGQSLIGVDQISGTMLLYITFLGAAWVLRRDEHVSIDILVAQLSPGVRRRLNIVNSVIGAIVCFVVTVYGTLEVVQSWQRGILVAAEIEIPRAINLAVIPLGSFFLWLQFTRRAWACLRGGAVER